MVKNLPASQGDAGLTLDPGRSPGAGDSNPLQYFCLENPLERGAWQVTVYSVTKSWIRLSGKRIDAAFSSS